MRINTPGLSAMGKRRGACAAVAFYGNKRKVVAPRERERARARANERTRAIYSRNAQLRCCADD